MKGNVALGNDVIDFYDIHSIDKGIYTFSFGQTLKYRPSDFPGSSAGILIKSEYINNQSSYVIIGTESGGIWAKYREAASWIRLV